MSTEIKFVLRMTRGQQMALLDIIMQSMSCPNKKHHTEVFINCSEVPPKETTIADLLNLIQGSSDEMEVIEKS